MPPERLLEIDSLRIAFHAGDQPREAVSGASLAVHAGEVVALVGESGSGKTLTSLAVTGLLPRHAIAYVEGRILFKGCDMMNISESELRRMRGSRIAYVFQEAATALNPVLTAGYQITEALRMHMGGGRYGSRVEELLRLVGLEDAARIASSYPHQLSGGQQQRVMMAIALACDPDLLIADEPTTALDVTVQAQILDLLKKIQKERGMAVLLITHNLAIAGEMADRMYVMYAGQIVENGGAREMIRNPCHPYTRALLRAVPRLRGTAGQLEGIPGMIPSEGLWPTGCRFHPRCSMSRVKCNLEIPIMQKVSGARSSRCMYWREMVG